jgi:hypothetical protein
MSLDLATVNAPGDHMVLIATEPLTSNEAWQPFAPGELKVFVAGEQVWSRQGSGSAQAPRPGRRGAIPASRGRAELLANADTFLPAISQPA